MVPALVLTAGLATRLRPLSLVRAKAALPVAGVPIVHRILRSLRASGITDVVLNLHHLPHTLTAIVGDGSDLGVHARYSWETPVLGSAGGPRRALPLLTGLGTRDSGLESTFLIVNGDTLTNVDIAALLAHHKESGALVTMAVVPNTEPEKYSGILADRDGIMTGVAPRGAADRSWHFIGVKVADAAAFESVPANVPYESVGALYPSLLASRRGSIRVFQTSAEFFDIGTPADYLDTSLRFSEREGSSPVPTSARVHASAHVDRSILWDDVVVEEGAMLRECVVTDNVRIPSDTSWHGVTIRKATGELSPGERRIDGLAVAAL